MPALGMTKIGGLSDRAQGDGKLALWGAQLKLINNGFIKTGHSVIGGLVMASCLLASGTAALAADVTDPGVIVAEPSPLDPQPEPAPVDPAPADPGPLPVPVEPVPVPMEPAPAPVVPAPVPVVPVPVVPVPAPLPAPPAPVQVPLPVRPVPAPVVALPLRPQMPGSAASQVPAPQATPLSQVIDSLAALADQSALDVPENGAGTVPGVAIATSPALPSSKATAASALASKEPVAASQGLPALAQTQIKAAVAVAAGSPLIVQLMTVLALVAAGVAYFRVMGAKGARAPGQSRK